MTPLCVSGFGAITSAGLRPGSLAERVSLGVATPAHLGVSIEGLYAQAMPSATGHALIDFDVRAQLGRKGTSFYDRATALAVVAYGMALRDAGIEVDDESRSRIGVALGTTLGSFKSTSDFSMETLVQPKPYLVNPVLFPNTVMNCAAGQAAIRYGLRGVNATITGGSMAFLNALRYAGNAINRSYADTMLVGAVEEFTPHRAWMAELAPRASDQVRVDHGQSAPAGEAAAVFSVSAASSAEVVSNSAARSAEAFSISAARSSGVFSDGAGGRAPVAAILAVATGFGPDGEVGAAIANCVRRALRQANVDGDKIWLHATGELCAADDTESRPVNDVLGREPRRLSAAHYFGDCGAATGAVALATVLELHEADPGNDGRLTLLTARTADGAAGAAIVRGWSRGGADRG